MRVRTQPEPTESLWIDGAENPAAREPRPVPYGRSCDDCGRPVELDGEGNPFAVCRSCYDVYVENAGR